MSRIDDLIRQYAPDGIDYKPLGEVGTFVRGNGLQKKDFVDVGFPCIHYGQIYTYYGTSTTSTKSFVTDELSARLRRAKPGDLVIATTSENIEDVGKAVVWLGEGEVAFGGHTSVFRHSLEPKYVAYFFQAESFQAQKKKYVSGTKVKELPFAGISKIKIPVPPLEVQREIVRVLDAFVELEAELEAELDARSQQYDHYRDSLLEFRGRSDVKWIRMGEVGDFFRGRRFTKSDAVPDGIPSIHYGEIYTHYGVCAKTSRTHVRTGMAASLRYARPGDVVIASVGETVADVGKAVAWLGEGDIAIHDDTFAFRSNMDPTYVVYVMQTAAFHRQKEQYVARSKVKRVGGENLGKIVIPVPPLGEQRRIVSTLNKFDALMNDLSSGLPAEIEARRQQYAYYRDRLLTFKEKTA